MTVNEAKALNKQVKSINSTIKVYRNVLFKLEHHAVEHVDELTAFARHLTEEQQDQLAAIISTFAAGVQDSYKLIKNKQHG